MKTLTIFFVLIILLFTFGGCSRVENAGVSFFFTEQIVNTQVIEMPAEFATYTIKVNNRRLRSNGELRAENGNYFHTFNNGDEIVFYILTPNIRNWYFAVAGGTIIFMIISGAFLFVDFKTLGYNIINNLSRKFKLKRRN